MQNLLNIVVAVVLPIIPAYLLYKTLPSRATVSGPFKGLSIQLKGAFGGYFLIVLVIFSYFMWSQQTQPPLGLYEPWTVTGTIGFPGRIPASQNETSFTVFPPDKPSPDWAFTLHIQVARGAKGFPTFVINIPGYEPYTVHLDPLEPRGYGGFDYRLEHHDLDRWINVKEIIMKEVSSQFTPPLQRRH